MPAPWAMSDGLLIHCAIGCGPRWWFEDWSASGVARFLLEEESSQRV